MLSRGIHSAYPNGHCQSLHCLQTISDVDATQLLIIKRSSVTVIDDKVVIEVEM